MRTHENLGHCVPFLRGLLRGRGSRHHGRSTGRSSLHALRRRAGVLARTLAQGVSACHADRT